MAVFRTSIVPAVGVAIIGSHFVVFVACVVVHHDGCAAAVVAVAVVVKDRAVTLCLECFVNTEGE